MQSILEKDLCSLRENNDKEMVKKANEYLLKKRFDLGTYPDTYHTQKISSLLYSDSCDTLENVQLYYINEQDEIAKCECTCEEEPKTCIPCKQTIIGL